MPNFSISVPDDLWQEVKRVQQPKESNSAVVQRALRLLASREGANPGSHLVNAADQERVDAIATAKRDEAAKAYAAGYAAGLSLADKWPWQVIDWASQYDFDLARLADEDEEWGETVYPNGTVEEDVAETDADGKGSLFVAGRIQALRDVWTRVSAPGDA